MIISMTGYGDSCFEIDGVSYAVEIRTVNNRYFKANIRVPETAAFLEDTVEKLLKSLFSRGMVNYTLRIKNFKADQLIQIDSQLLKGYYEQITKASNFVGDEQGIKISDILDLPGIITPVEPDEETSEKMKNAVIEVSKSAVEKVRQMRIEEGKALWEDLDKNCSSILNSLQMIETKKDIVIQEYYQKLQKRVDQLLNSAQLKIDNELLARETAVFAERCDISEEISRLKSHISQFRSVCTCNGDSGKKLDFITQEMLREANTIASKASDAQIAAAVVDIKCFIDRLKEQVQNIE